MKLKRAVTMVLLVFVAASVTFAIVREFRTVENGSEPDGPIVLVKGQPVPEKAHVIAYYFHGNFRCATCRRIEAYARETVESGFGDALKNGKLVWRVVNVEDPGNGHFVQDYQLRTRSVVLVLMKDGKQENWQNLDRVWELVRDKEAFVGYVKQELRDQLRDVE